MWSSHLTYGCFLLQETYGDLKTTYPDVAFWLVGVQILPSICLPKSILGKWIAHGICSDGPMGSWWQADPWEIWVKCDSPCPMYCTFERDLSSSLWNVSLLFPSLCCHNHAFLISTLIRTWISALIWPASWPDFLLRNVKWLLLFSTFLPA